MSNRCAVPAVIRNHVYDLFELFDFPDPGTVNGIAPIPRSRTGVISDEQPARPARYRIMAEALLKEADLPTRSACSGFMRRCSIARPRRMETQRAVVFINNFAQDRLASSVLSQALVSSNEFLYLK